MAVDPLATDPSLALGRSLDAPSPSQGEEGSSGGDSPSVPLPGYLRFTRMLFLDAASLFHELDLAGIDEPRASGWQQWQRARAGSKAHREYLLRLAFLILVVGPCLVLLLGAVLDSVEGLWLWKEVARGLALGVGIALVGGFVGSWVTAAAFLGGVVAAGEGDLSLIAAWGFGWVGSGGHRAQLGPLHAINSAIVFGLAGGIPAGADNTGELVSLGLGLILGWLSPAPAPDRAQ